MVLLSGRGSNFVNLAKKLTAAKIISVFSNKAEAPGLALASELKIPNQAFPRKSYSSVQDQKRAIFEATKKLNPDLVVLAGFMSIIEPEFIAAFPGRIVNIHPALLPEFPGIDTHRRALEAQAKKHGCTVHVVDPGVDTGPIIAQASCQVMPNDSEDTLAQRVLELEHQLFPWVVDQIATGSITISDKGISYSNAAKQSAARLGFITY